MARARFRAYRIWAVAAVLLSAAVTGIGLGPAATADVTEVKGSAFGFSASVSLFGGPAGQRGPAPTVTLPAGGSASPVVASAPSGSAVYGPATIFSAGSMNVSTQGTTGATGSVTSTATVASLNTSQTEILTATSVSSTCTANEAGVTGSSTLTDAVLIVTDPDPDVTGEAGEVIVNLPTNPAPNTRHSGTISPPVSDNFEYIFNEQITAADGTLTVNAAHLRLLGPTAVGDVIIGQSVCDVTAAAGPTTTAGNTSTTAGNTTTTAGNTTTTAGATTTSSTAATTTSTTAATTTTTAPGNTTTTTGSTTGVAGGAYGFYISVGLFGGPASVRGPAPTVTLPAGGSATPVTATAAEGNGVFGPATIFSSGKLDVSTQGSPGGSVTSTATVENVNKSGQEVFTAATASSTCTASSSGASGSTTLTGASLITSEVNIDIDEDDIKVQLPSNPAPNTTHEGKIETVQDSFRYVFNEQIRGADGSITVNAAHLYLLGPTAVGELIIGQSRCGITAAGTGGGGGGSGGGGGGGGGTGIASTGGAIAVFFAFALLLVVGGWSTLYWSAGAQWRERVARRMPWATRGLLR